MSKGGPLMMLISSWSEAIRHLKESVKLVQREPVPDSCRSTCFIRTNKTNRFFYVAVVGAGLIGFNSSIPAWSADASTGKARTTVAAGLGYQDADTSSITVKTYDAESGEVLSAETYELDIKDDGPPSSHPRTRIFAGGVGAGSDGLSEFTLRVYDAANGRFLWEGRLNLGVGSNPDVAAFPVVAQIQPRPAMVKVTGRTKTSGQPYFVIRAVNPETGQLAWSDEFSADPANVKVERISRSVIGMTGVIPREIDFRIKMPDEAGRQLLWEDKVVPNVEEETALPERSEDSAGNLPMWPQGSSQRVERDGI
jgi:outer membrane protein assembly factor BamB